MNAIDQNCEQASWKMSLGDKVEVNSKLFMTITN
jgi:hypothetical protein